MPPNAGDTYAILKPKDQWPDGKTKNDVVEDLERAAKTPSGTAYFISQPIQMRFNELVAGIRSDVVCRSPLQLARSFIRQPLVLHPGAS